MRTATRRTLLAVSFLSLWVLVFARADGRTWYVRSDGTGDAPTIQAGIDSAAAGDSVLVGAGVYAETLDMQGKPLVLVGEAGATATIVDAGQSHRVLAMDGGVLEGLTIRNGRCNCNGAGVFIAPPGPAIVRNTIIEENRAEVPGLNAGAGGGVFIDPGAANVVVESNIVQNNFCGVVGAGIFDDGALSVIRDNVVRGNTSGGAAGGILSMQGRVTGNLVLGNLAVSGGSGIHSEGPAELRNNTVVRNAGGAAAGIVGLGLAVISHNIVADNRGVGVSFFGSNEPDCNDIWLNDTPTSGWPGTGNGNFSADPLFCEPDAGVFALHASSPCLPANNPGCGLVGAFGVGCTIAVQPTTWGAVKLLYR